MPSTTTADRSRRALGLLGGAAIVALLACGGRSAKRTDPVGAPGGSSAQGGSGAGIGGTASGTGGASAAGSGTGGTGATGALDAGAQGGSAQDGGLPVLFHVCFDWGEEIESDGAAGAGGQPACPEFNALRYTDQFREEFGACFWRAAFQTPVVDPPDTEPGDCCYAIGAYHCR